MLHCDLRVRWKVASDLRFRAAIPEPKTPSFCGISGDLAQSTRKSLAIAIVRFWCAKHLQDDSSPQKGPADRAHGKKRQKSYDPAGLVKSPKTLETQKKKYEKIREKDTNPPPRVGSQKYRKNTEKIQKLSFLYFHFVFFRYFFRILGTPPWVGSLYLFLVILSYFLGFKGFWATYQAGGIVTKIVKKWRKIFSTLFDVCPPVL